MKHGKLCFTEHTQNSMATNPPHSLGLVQVVTNGPKLPKWAPDTTWPVPQPRVLEMVGQNYPKLIPKEDLSLGTTAASPSQ